MKKAKTAQAQLIQNMKGVLLGDIRLYGSVLLVIVNGTLGSVIRTETKGSKNNPFLMPAGEDSYKKGFTAGVVMGLLSYHDPEIWMLDPLHEDMKAVMEVLGSMQDAFNYLQSKLFAIKPEYQKECEMLQKEPNHYTEQLMTCIASFNLYVPEAVRRITERKNNNSTYETFCTNLMSSILACTRYELEKRPVYTMEMIDKMMDEDKNKAAVYLSSIKEEIGREEN